MPITIYTKGWCPYCSAAKDLLTQKGVAFQEIEISGNSDERAAMIRRAGGRSTVPQIFIGERHVGGCDDLYALDRGGELDKLLDNGGLIRPQRSQFMSGQTFIAACIGMRSGRDRLANRDAAVRLIEEAATSGAADIQTPEMTSLVERSRKDLFEKVGPEESDPTLTAMRELARKRRLTVHIGSIAVRSGDKIANRAYLINPEGAITARYDKIHLFDVNLPNGESWREFATYTGGDSAVLAETPWGLLGLTICYDVRFPALYRALAEAGASFLSAPACFTRQTGEAHWSVLHRARAIETGSFMISAAQGGIHDDGRETYGHSIIIDPWGRVLAEGGIEPGVVLAEIDPAQVGDARARIPALQHARPFRIEVQAASAARPLAAAE